VEVFQAFMKEFYDVAPPPLKLRAKYILHSLLAAMGFDKTEEEVKVSQLAMEVDEIQLDPILMQWVTMHVSSVQKVAGL